jgi:hypothetical protein
MTLTLWDTYLSVEPAVPLEQAERALGAAGVVETDLEAPSAGDLKPVAAALGKPTQVRDVNVAVEDGSLRITLWKRWRGLRVVPVAFTFDQVDNQEAAEAFAEEVERRQVQAPHPGKLRGPFDYWATWGVVLAAGGALFAYLLSPEE